MYTIETTDKGKMSYSQSVVKHEASAQQFEVETRKIVNQTLHVLLADEGVIMNQSRRGNCDGEKDVVREGLIGACKKMLATHREELRVQLDQLDLSPSALCMSYHQLANGLLEDGCNWGKLVMLFTASSLITARIHFDGYAELAVSIQEWLIGIVLRPPCKDWILQHEGWDSFPDTFSRYKRKTDVAPPVKVIVNKPRWPTAAVLGVTAAVGLGLSILGAINKPM